jgi:hypothetical protein
VPAILEQKQDMRQEKAKGKCCWVNRSKDYVKLVNRKFLGLCIKPSLALPELL